MEWYVYYYDINHGNIVTYNIFDHGRFGEDFNKLISDYNITKEEFANKLDIMLRYYFWSKGQWETFLKPWFGDSKVEKKIDVYDQIKLNWDNFLEYAYNYKLKRYADVIEYEKYKNIGTVEECEKAMKFAKHCQEENKYL